MGSTLYTSEDTGAPELRPLDGSLIEVFKKCLVDGYGSKTSLGWTIEFEDLARNIIVFRMPSGSRTYLRFVDDGVPSTINATVQAYETMSGIDLGIHPCISTTEITYIYVRKNNSTIDTRVSWRIVGDDKGFYFYVRPYHNIDVAVTLNYHLAGQVFYFGDYVPYRQEDKNNFIMNAAQNTVSRCYFNPSTGLAVGTGWRMMRGFDDEKGSVTCGLGSCTSYSTTIFGDNVDLSPLSGRFLYIPVSVHSTTHLMGVMPGLSHPLHKFSSPATIEEMQEFYESDENGIYGISLGTSRGTSQTYMQRIMFRIGEGFRNAY